MATKIGFDATETNPTKSGQATSVLRFPMNKIDDYRGTIRFEILEYEGVNISGSTSGVDGNNTEGFDFNSIGNFFSDIFGNGLDVLNDVGTTVTGGRGFVTTGNFINLFLPPGITFADAVELDTATFGTVGSTVLAGLEGMGSERSMSFSDMGNMAVNSFVNSITDIFQGNGGGEDAARYAAVRLSKAIPGNQGLSAVAELSAQATDNPNKRVLFKSVNIRQFGFSFRFVPTSPEEAQAVEDIVKSFRTNMYPERFDVADIPFGYKFPKLFLITYLHKGEQVGFRMLPCYLENMNVTYNQSSMAFFEDNKFTETNISLSFKEYRALDKSDIENGY